MPSKKSKREQRSAVHSSANRDVKVDNLASNTVSGDVMTLLSDIFLVLRSILKNGEDTFGHMERALQKEKAEVLTESLFRNPHLRRFLDKDDIIAFTLQDSSLLIKELERTWPHIADEVGELNRKDLTKIKRVINAAGLYIPYHNLRFFIPRACSLIRDYQGIPDEDNLIKLVKETARTTERLIENVQESGMPVDLDDTVAYIVTEYPTLLIGYKIALEMRLEDNAGIENTKVAIEETETTWKRNVLQNQSRKKVVKHKITEAEKAWNLRFDEKFNAAKEAAAEDNVEGTVDKPSDLPSIETLARAAEIATEYVLWTHAADHYGRESEINSVIGRMCALSGSDRVGA